MKLTEDERTRIGQALNDAIAEGAPEADYTDSREIDRLVDAVAAVLESPGWRMRPPLYPEGPMDHGLHKMATAHDKLVRDADDFLKKALAAFVGADYHPFGDIESEIKHALSLSLEDKHGLLRRLPAMLAKSDFAETRALGAEIEKYMGDMDAGSTYV